MNAKRTYSYVLLRYRHDPVAGEFVNVGVVVHEPESGFLGVKVRHTTDRLWKFFPDIDTDIVKETLINIEMSINSSSYLWARNPIEQPRDARAIATKILPDDDSCFICAPASGSGVTADPTETLNKLYSRFVGRYDDRPREQPGSELRT